MRAPQISLLACVFFAGRVFAGDDAAQILKATEQAYQNLTSYEFKGITASETKVGSSISKTETQFAVAFKQPNEFRIEYDYPSAGEWIRASDGKTVWNKRSITKEYTETPASDDALRMLDGSPIAPFQAITQDLQNPAVAGNEPVSIGGQSFDCYVIQGTHNESTVSGTQQAVPVKLWIDKTRHLILKQVSGSEDAGAAKSTENQRTLSFTEVVVNSAVPDDLFHVSKK